MALCGEVIAVKGNGFLPAVRSSRTFRTLLHEAVGGMLGFKQWLNRLPKSPDNSSVFLLLGTLKPANTAPLVCITSLFNKQRGGRVALQCFFPLLLKG